MSETVAAAVGFAAAGAAALGLAACDNGPSAVQTRDRAAEAAPNLLSLSDAGTASAAPVAAEVQTPAAVTANRRETADVKIQRLFERNGAAFGARTAEDYMDRVKAFTSRPPTDVDRATRPNGDVLLYQASTNTFAVVSRDGTPRTMFKPDDGARYWAEQKARAPSFGQRRASAE
ncbi:S-type pyocin family protein [Brevundimonas sp. VNH65]|uniref:S-type pyocin family protein n=1 Tax=Brevundimonas sp. VNH65 TaxID=3400917 RepID=UPI003BFC166B